MSEIIELDLSNQEQLEILAIYLKETLSETSFEIWDELTIDDETDIDNIVLTAGKAVLNEAFIKAIEAGMKEEQNKLNDSKKELNTNE